MVDAHQLRYRRIVGQVAGELLNGVVQLQQQAALAVFPHQALNPEKGRQTGPLGDRCDPVQTGARIEHQVPGRQFDCASAVGVFNHQFTTFVVFRFAEKQGGGKIGANTLGAARHTENGTIDMVAIVTAALIAIEARGKNLQRQGRSHEQRVLHQRIKNQVADLLGAWVIRSQLQVVLGFLGVDEYNSDARQRTTADINQRLGTGNTAVRLNLLVEDSGIAGRELANTSAFGIAPSVTFGLDSPTRFILAYQYLQQEERPDWGVPAAMIEGMMRYDADAARADRDNYYGLASDYDDTTSDSLLARIEHDFANGIKLSNQTRVAQTEREARFTSIMGYTPDTQQVQTQTQIYDRDATSLANLTNLGIQFETGSIRHNLAAGIEFSLEESEARRYGAGSPPDADIFEPDPNRAPVFGLSIGGGLQHVGNSWAGRPDDASRIIPNGRFGKLPGYTLVNLMASYEINDYISLRLNVDNVTNELYATSTNWPGQRALLGAPRTYLLSADISF